MRRREFIAGLGGAAAFPLAARPQQAERMRRVGVLFATLERDPAGKSWMAAFTKGLQQFGWAEGRNVEIDRRWGGSGIDEPGANAADVLSLKPNVVLVQDAVSISALQRIGGGVPIVFAGVSDPVGLGFVGSLAHPGGNITGFTIFDVSVAGKLLEALKEIAPGLAVASMIFGANNPAGPKHFRALETAALPAAVKVLSTPVRDKVDIERAIESIVREPNGGLIVPPDNIARAHRELIVALAARHRLPAAFPDRSFVESGGLMSYGPDFDDNYRRAAGYVDRILRGERAGDLPVQQPTKFELVINLKTAKSLGLTIPETLLATADEVIQ
jgi:putative tryptophan/tyrosine transport system substrate-binding protein